MVGCGHPTNIMIMINDVPVSQASEQTHIFDSNYDSHKSEPEAFGIFYPEITDIELLPELAT